MNGEDFIEELPYLAAGLVLIDIKSAGANGYEAIVEVARGKFASPIIAMTNEANVKVAVEALKRGAVDFLEKPIAPDALHEAVAAAEKLLEQRRVVYEQTEQDKRLLDHLTARERQVLKLLAAGHTSKAVAREVGISPRTVEAHRASLLEKLGLQTTAAAIALSVRYDTAVLAHAARVETAGGAVSANRSG